jgi:2-polyprenyl-3-methyl-5-hydroxy-6-metoxy-1,4-benzoquinol methylase
MDALEALRIVQADYCSAISAQTVEQSYRDLFKIGLVQPCEGLSLCDVGGGLGAFGPACAILGASVTVIDDFKDPVNFKVGEAGFIAHRKHGVQVVVADASRGLPVDRQFDTVTCFASIEHYHDSPRAMLHSMMDHLKPGGRFVLSVPNAVDLMKRIETVLGRAKWSPLEEWYATAEFRGHVREPVVSDLEFIARDLGLQKWRVVGKTFIWIGTPTVRRIFGAIARVVDHRAGLSSELFLVGYKADTAHAS